MSTERQTNSSWSKIYPVLGLIDAPERLAREVYENLVPLDIGLCHAGRIGVRAPSPLHKDGNGHYPERVANNAGR